MELYLGEGGGSGEEAKLSLGTAGERTQPQSRPAPPLSRRVDINTQVLSRAPGRGREERGCFLICTAPHHTGEGGQQGEEVTVKQAIAASATTLQQCGLPGSSAQPGGNRSSTRDWWRWLGGKVFATLARLPGKGNCCSANSGETVPWRHAGPRSSAHRKALQQCQSPGVPCPAPVQGRLPSLQPGSSLLLTVVYGLPAMALSQSLIPAYPPLTSFQDSAADARDFRVVLCTVQRKANAGGHGAATQVEKRV